MILENDMYESLTTTKFYQLFGRLGRSCNVKRAVIRFARNEIDRLIKSDLNKQLEEEAEFMNGCFESLKSSSLEKKDILLLEKKEIETEKKKERIDLSNVENWEDI